MNTSQVLRGITSAANTSQVLRDITSAVSRLGVSHVYISTIFPAQHPKYDGELAYLLQRVPGAQSLSDMSRHVPPRRRERLDAMQSGHPAALQPTRLLGLLGPGARAGWRRP